MLKCVASSMLVLTLVARAAWSEPTTLNGAEINILLSDQELVGDAGVSQIFQASGMTLYTERGAQSIGQWKVDGDKYCSVWPPSTYWSCYDVLRDGQQVTFISAAGKPFPMTLKARAE